MTTSHMSKVIQELHRAEFARDGEGLTDGQILECFLDQRDAAAFEVLVRRHGPMVLSACRRLLGNDHDAEDAFQATFLVFARKAATVSPREMVGNWLYGVAYRTALKARSLAAKRRVREKQVTTMPEPEAARDDPWPDWQPMLDQELSRLPDKYRVPIILCELEGKTLKEAARQLGWPEGTVAGRLSRARTMLAKRLKRQGAVLASGSLAVLLSQNTASAAVPTSLLVTTVKAASLIAAGQALPAGVLSTQVVALSEGVLKAMLITKLKMATTALLLAVLTGLGGNALLEQALADKPRGAEQAGAAEVKKEARQAPSLTAKVIGVSTDGKIVTLETPGQNRGDAPLRSEIHIDDKTAVNYQHIPLNGAKPTEGYQAQVWLQPGSTTKAARLNFTAVDATKGGRGYLSAQVSAVGADGKSFSVEIPLGRGPAAEKKKMDFKLTDQSKITYVYVGKDGNKPTVGYRAEVWLDDSSRENLGNGMVAKVNFVDGNRERANFSVSGKVVAVATTDGITITVETPPQNRGEGAKKTEIKLLPKTSVTFDNVGPDAAKIAEGYLARVWLEDGSTNTADRVILSPASTRADGR